MLFVCNKVDVVHFWHPNDCKSRTTAHKSDTLRAERKFLLTEKKEKDRETETERDKMKERKRHRETERQRDRETEVFLTNKK